MNIKMLIAAIAVISSFQIAAQCFITGADLSYVNEIEANGGIYRDENGNETDPFELFAERGAQMVRARLWHTPENNQGQCGPITSGSLADVIKTFERAKSAGMQLKLAIHYGDYFVDPAKQKRPKAWDGLSHAVLLDSIYDYTTNVLNALKEADVVPQLVAIGNETTWGFIDETAETNGWSWPQDAEKFNTGLKAVDDFNTANSTTIQKAIHLTSETVTFNANLFKQQGITNFDIIGVSFYPMWSDLTSLAQLGTLIRQLNQNHDQQVMIFEAGAPWTTANADDYGNFMSGFGELDYEVSLEGHRQFLLDLAEVVYENGGTGILYWEPAWISSEMCDLWGQGSSYENVGFFDFNDSNKATGSFDFFSYCGAEELSNQKLAGDIKVFPNPTEDTLYIRGLKDQLITVTNLEGKKVTTIKLIDGKLDLGDLTAGTYLMHFERKGKSECFKVVKR